MASKPVDPNKIVESLQRASVFSGLTKKQLESLAKNSKERTFRAGERIVREGESGVGFYLILEGHVDVNKGGKSLAKLGSGQFFGELTLLDDQPRSADVTALEDTRCLLMTTWEFRAFLKTNPDASLAVLRELARRLREAGKLAE